MTRASALLLVVVACGDPVNPSVALPPAAGSGGASGVGGGGGMVAGTSAGGAGSGGGGASSAAGSGGSTVGGGTAGGAGGSGGTPSNGGGGSGGVGQGGAGASSLAGTAGAPSDGGSAGSGAGAGGVAGLAGNAGGGAGGVAGGAAGSVAAGSSGVAGAPNGGTGSALAAELDGYRFECPCKPGAENHTSDSNCNVTPETDRQTTAKTMGGDPGTVYDVTLRVRGLTEPNTYKNGTRQGERFYIGGTTNTAGYTSYMMTVADPPQHFFFNFSATTGHVHFALDYEVTVKIRGGSQVTFDVDGDGSVPDGHQVSNFDQLVVPDVPPAPAAYDGQFVQLDVVSVAPAP